MKCALQYTPSLFALRRQARPGVTTDHKTPYHGLRLKQAQLALLMASLLLVMQPLSVQAAGPVVLDMASQPLADALLQIGRQAQVEIAFSPGQVREKRALALQGELTVEQALETLLAPWGLAAQAQGEGRYMIVTARVAKGLSVLEPVRVQGQQVGERIYSRDDMDQRAAGNRDLSGLLADNPAVRQNEAAKSGANRGSMALEDISFYGASPFQNQFQIDGISATNQIDPASRNLNLQAGNVPAYAQAYNLDTNMLESVTVLDSSIPVEYGRFTGGVVDAKVRDPKGDNSFRADFSYNSSGLTSQKIAPEQQKKFEAGEPGFTPAWTKRFSSAMVDVRITEDTAALINVSRRESTIDRTMRVLHYKELKDVSTNSKDRVDNVFAKVHTRWSASTDSALTFKYADRREDLVDSSMMANGIQWQHQQKAYGLGFDLNHDFVWGQGRVQLGYDQMNSYRNSDDTAYMVHMVYQPNGRLDYNYMSGGFGQESTEQLNLTLKSRLEFKPFQTGAIEHAPYVGLDLAHTKGEFVRHQDAYGGQTRHFSNGQPSKVQTLNFYRAGEVGVSYTNASVYVSDRLSWQRLALTTGLRVDRDNYFGNTNVAPRTLLEWDVLGTGETRLSGGWSRYYGMDILGIAMRERKSQLHTLLITGGNPVDRPSHTVYTLDGLKTPYDDEWALRLNQQLSSNVAAELAYVRRYGRQQVSIEGLAKTGHTYTNNGSSKTDAVTLSLMNTAPWTLGESLWTARLDVTYQHSKRNTKLADGYDGEAEELDDEIYYNGDLIRRGDRPVGDYNLPWRVSAGVTGMWARYGLQMNNRVNWNGARTDVHYVGLNRGDGLEKYESGRVGSYWTWDMRLDWEPAMFKGLGVGLDVLNVLDKQAPVVVATPTSVLNQNLYRTGRELWLRASYQY
ncbi:TonB-dependent receptor [Alcaligenes parafaecalis]|uniref:TonB-dependent receptor n=1 Tax=Alcaligenes parafaecalis TaxID=171260 RepID=A0ABT3VHI7_9BURK|nr:TonB-dependent receptor [Alcaligenes parafaecalis]MCX5462680.1 TonB-dependent receptor [Alcaligenes parafaecalis]